MLKNFWVNRGYIEANFEEILNTEEIFYKGCPGTSEHKSVVCFHWPFCTKFNSEQLLFEAFFDECYCSKTQTNQKWKNKNHTVKMAVKKLPKNIYILFCLIDMKRYFKNIDISISYCYIDI